MTNINAGNKKWLTNKCKIYKDYAHDDLRESSKRLSTVFFKRKLIVGITSITYQLPFSSQFIMTACILCFIKSVLEKIFM